MKYRIHYKLEDGSEDSLVIEGDSLDEICDKASVELKKRNAKDPWSEELWLTNGED